MEAETALKAWHLNPGATDDVLRDALASLGHSLPATYIRFLQKHDGGEGFVGDNYLIIWKAEELSVFNREYEVDKYAPGLLMFGSNGGGEGYAFDRRSQEMNIVRVPFIGLSVESAIPMAESIDDLFAVLSK